MNYPLRSITWGSMLAFCAAVAGISAVLAQSIGLVAVYVEADSIIFEPTVPYELSITIAGPDDLLVEEAFGPGGAVAYSAGALADGQYKYEISILSMGTDAGISQTAALQLGIDESGRPVGAKATPVNGPSRQSGGFRVLNGVILDPSAPE